jgi:xylulokinase
MASSHGKYCLGIDVGTQGTKAILYDLHTHSIVGRGAHSYDLLPRASPNAAEQEPSTWLEGIRASVAEALSSAGADAEDLASVSVSGQQHGMVALDASGTAVRPAKLWCDTESAPEAEELSKAFGWSMQAGFTASKALWLKRHEPENWARTATILLPHDYVNWYLTGVLAMEAGDASGVGVLDLATRTFKDEWCAAVDARFASMLPKLLPPDATVGVVTAAAAAALGLRAGIPVAAGSGDNMMSALGAGCVAEVGGCSSSIQLTHSA